MDTAKILALHKQTNTVGDYYERAKSVALNNPKDGQRSVTFVKESIINLADGTKLATDKGLLVHNSPLPDDRGEVINLYNLQGEKVGQKTAGEIDDLIGLLLNSVMIEAEILKHTSE